MIGAVIQLVTSIAPAPVAAWAASFFDLFARTGLAHPHWEDQATRLAVALGTFLTIVLAALTVRLGHRGLKVLAWASLVATTAAFAAVLVLRAQAKQATVVAEIEYWKEWWSYGFFVFLVLLILTVFFAIRSTFVPP